MRRGRGSPSRKDAMTAYDKSLIAVHPELADQWSDKNLPLMPGDVSYGSNKIVWWVGDCGHEWEAKVKARSNGEGCPYCAGKRVGQGINDLTTIAPEVAAQWSDKNLPAKPQDYTAGSGFMAWWVDEKGHEWKASIKNRVNGSGCPYCSGQAVLPGFNDFQTLYPELAKEWSRKNKDFGTGDVTPMSNRRVLWKCSTCGYEWRAKVAERSRGSKCPACTGAAIIKNRNDLAATHPELARMWSDRNQDITPEMVTAASSENVWWKCDKCGHEWKAVVASRVAGRNGCPKCRRARNQQKKFEKDRSQQLQKEFREKIVDLMIYYYCQANKIRVWKQNRSVIGLPLQYYFPDYQAAIELNGRKVKTNRKQEVIKNRLCAKSGIWMIRMLYGGEPAFDDCVCLELTSDEPKEQFQAVQTAFQMLRLPVKINLDTDLAALYAIYCAL